MYKSIRIQNFRCFRDLELDDVSRINLIAGHNNSGKTSLLEAIFTYSGEYDASRLLRMPATRFYRTRLRESLESPYWESNIPSWHILFHNFKTDSPISLSGEYELHQQQLSLLYKEGENRKLKISLVNSSELPDDSWILRFLGGEVESPRLLSGELAILRFTTGTNKPFHMAQFMGSIVSDRRARHTREHEIPATFLASSEHVSMEDVAARFTDLKRARKQQWLLSALRTIEPRLQALELFYDGDPPVIHGDLAGIDFALPITSMGEGMRRLTSLLLAISSTSNGVVFVDEIENGLHHSVQVDVWKAIAEAARAYNVQIFATTHSYEMIQAAHKAFQDRKPFDFRLYRLDRETPNNEIRAVSYDKGLLDATIANNYEMR